MALAHDRVTVFGQSAGGGSVAAPLAMPRAAGLFHRAVAQSVPETFFSPELAADIAAAFAAELGVRPTVSGLSAVAPALLPAAGDAVFAKAVQRRERWGRIRGAWTAFAAHGDPGWPPYDTGHPLAQLFDTPSTVTAYPEETSRPLWQDHTFPALPLLTP